MASFADCYWSSSDGLKLHYRDYSARGASGGADRPPVICLPGLTRNARDFEGLAEHLSENWRVLCPEMRGRGDSDYAKDAATYNPMQYVQDIAALVEQEQIARFVAIGTSLGGLMTMVMALTMGQHLAGAVLNDIGPVLEPEGLERIRGYVGQGRSFATWMHAARAIEEMQKAAFPGFDIADWLVVAKRVMVLGSNGRVVFDYDMKIAEPFASAEGAGQVDMWPALAALAGKPVLLLRGELSDVLSVKTLEGMAERLPQAELLTIANVGHAPTLDEPEARAAIDRLLARVG